MNLSLLAGTILSTSIFNFAQSPEWISFFHGPGNVGETIENVTFDNSGNIYLSGYGYLTSGGGGPDFLTVKCNSDGAEEWSRVYNGPQNDTDRPFGIFVDDNGNVYVTGTSRWTSLAYKIVTLKYSPDGSLLWRCAFDSLGQSDGESKDIWVDNNGNIYVTGWISQINNGYYDVATIKMDSNGNILDWDYFGQVNNVSDYGRRIISDNNGNVITGGESFRNVNLGQEVVLINYNNNLDTNWVVRVNGSDNSLNEFIVEIALDDTGNVYSLCRLQNSPGSTDFAVLKIKPDGEVIWRVEYDEAGGQDIPEAMVIDNNGNIFVTGRVRRTGYNDFVVIKYDNTGNQIWKSYYDGPESFDDDPINICVDQNQNVFVCGEINPNGGSHFKFTVVKFNSDGSFDWDYIYDENVSSRAFGVWADNFGNIYAAGDGEGPGGNQDLMAVKLSKTSDIKNESEMPSKFHLYQNYPNPFNPSTKIRYTIPNVIASETKQSQFVSLKVYDVLGNEVATLVNAYKSAGSYEVEFGSHSDEGQNLPSGVYFYQLRVGGPETSSGQIFAETKKMILMR